MLFIKKNVNSETLNIIYIVATAQITQQILYLLGTE